MSKSSKKSGWNKDSLKDDPDSVEANIRTIASPQRLASAGRKAISTQKKLGLSVTFKRGNKVIQQYPDGREKVLEELPPPKYKLPVGIKILGKK